MFHWTLLQILLILRIPLCFAYVSFLHLVFWDYSINRCFNLICVRVLVLFWVWFLFSGKVYYSQFCFRLSILMATSSYVLTYSWFLVRLVKFLLWLSLSLFRICGSCSASNAVHRYLALSWFYFASAKFELYIFYLIVSVYVSTYL